MEHFDRNFKPFLRHQELKSLNPPDTLIFFFDCCGARSAVSASLKKLGQKIKEKERQRQHLVQEKYKRKLTPGILDILQLRQRIVEKKNKANKLHFLNSDFTLEDITLHSHGAFRGFNK